MYRVIIVDDEPAAIKHIELIIRKKCPEYEVIDTAGNGREALEKIRLEQPDVVISDIKMPLMSGLRLAEVINEEKLPVYSVIVSGYQEFEYARTAIRAGVCDYIIKPIVPAALKEVLNQIALKLKADYYYEKNRIIRKLCNSSFCTGEEVERCFPYKRYYRAIIRRNGLPRRFASGSGNTLLYRTMYEQDSLLLALKPKKPDESKLPEAAGAVADMEAAGAVADMGADGAVADMKAAATNVCGAEDIRYERITTEDRVKIILEEPNVIVLDQAEYCFDNGAWEPREEILRSDNKFRELLGYPLRMRAFAQPWIESADMKTEHKLSLRIPVHSETEADNVWLGMEEGEDADITWNGKDTRLAEGYYIDSCVRKVELGPLRKGENELKITIPFHRKRNIEAMYLLGDFGARVSGSAAIVTEPVRALAFGDITMQGLPFYGGNLTYQIDIERKRAGKDVCIKVSKFRAPVLKVLVDGMERGYIALSPYRLNIGDLSAGKHRIEIIMFGNRINTLGTLHNCDENTSWFGPDAWRTVGDSWSYEYQLQRTGILKTPEISIS